MRRRSLLLALPAGLVALSGCGDDSGDSGSKESPSPDASSPKPEAAKPGKVVDGPLPEITEGAGFGETPKLAKATGKPSPHIAVQVPVEGKGTKVAKGDYVQVDYMGQVWGAEKTFETTFGKDQSAVFPIGQQQILPAWDQVLVGKTVGSRVQMAVPPKYGFGEQGQPQLKIKADDTSVWVLDVVDTFNAKSSAKGEEVAQDDVDLPKIGTNTNGKAPSIKVPDTKAPKKLVSSYVIEGDGPKVAEGGSVLVHYRGVLWDGGKEFDASYNNGSLAQFSLQQVVEGWSKGLAGKKAGSRVMIVVPPEQGYGKEGQGDKIPGNSTLVFSVDILAAM
ncbi:FKBP-type peptidyl-prolyl cis-trans isomerase [Streptomyces sp. P38-E01]|uniref:peptidylprolyl isomerase n=1 Tax=Streptomyces tardus TaxID=2780544 RepID=A0A949JGW1_9ACTN|nr:FKBP-type peptidyl-prolyl cis-trans isomerase [Streptomyces tardus]MBU7599876.1 FKBP-type peptidyl-prolyl cis-trans isomerase [Streptomyces tardus]